VSNSKSVSRRPRRTSEPTILDVAAAAGVSKSTAARALGGYGPVSDEVRERVAAAAANLSYRPNRVARSMTSGRTRTIGVVVGDIQLPFFAGAVRAIADVVQAEGWEVVLATTNEDLGRERTAVRVLFEKRVDGLIVAPASSESGEHLIQLSERGLPIVLLDRRVLGLRADVVVVDNVPAVENAVGYLAFLGHERIAIVGNTGLTSLPILSNPGVTDPAEVERGRVLAELKPGMARYRGYFAGLQAAGLPVDSELVRRADYTRVSAAINAMAVLARLRPATAIITTDSLMTLGVLDAVRQCGVRIPDELSLIGFDDADWATVAVPAITVIAQPVLELGAAAAHRLLARITGDDRPPEIIVLDTHLVARGSTARLRIDAAVAGDGSGLADTP
jgi:LacI family transcriptional regulator